MNTVQLQNAYSNTKELSFGYMAALAKLQNKIKNQCLQKKLC